MTELTAFLASIYDAFSEAEMQALQHGQARLAELLESGTVPDDVSVPVYHASEVDVNLDVGLVAEETEDGMEVFVTDADQENASELNFGVELFELLEKEDLEDIDYDSIFPGPGGGFPTGTPTEEAASREKKEEERREKEEEKRRREEDEEERREKEDKREEEQREEETEDREGKQHREIEAEVPPIDVIDDIGPRNRARLRDAGIERLPQLLDRSPEELADTLAEADAEVSRERAADWLSEARGLASLLADRDADLPVELVNGIGPTFGSRLREAGLGDLSDLAAGSPEEIAELASTDAVTVSEDRAAEWLEQAASHLQAVESGDQPELHSGVDRIDVTGASEGSSAGEEPQSETAEPDEETHE